MSIPMLFGIPFFAALGLMFAWFGRRQVTFASHFSANRSIGLWVAAVSFPVCWTWANTLIIGPQRAFQAGLSEAIWFALLNALALAVFAACATRLEKVARLEIPTLTGFVRERYAPEMVWVYSIGISGIALYAVVGQFIGALVLVEYVTGLTRDVLVLVLAPMMLALALPRGVESSFASDMVKAATIGVVLIVALCVLNLAGGPAIHAGLPGAGKGFGFLDGAMLSAFVLPLAISWISGGALDHQLYQRARSLSYEARYAPWLGIVPFALLVFAVSALGFVAPRDAMRGLDPQLAGFVAVEATLPGLGQLFMLAIASALMATGASALNAAASAWAVDIVGPWRPKWSAPWVSRAIMLATLMVAMALAMSGVTLLTMVLFIGAFRGALLFPTLLALWTERRAPPSRGFAWGIASAMLVGPFVAWQSTPLWGGVTALALTAVMCLLEWRRNRAFGHP